MNFKALSNIAKKIKPKEDNKVVYPKDHKLGMKVPETGSHCANCKFLGEDHKTCKNKIFIKWNKDSNKLPEKDEKYCCDMWELGNKTIQN